MTPDPGPAGVRLTGLHLYPLKSAAAFSVSEAEVDEIGLVGDRRWMLVDEAGLALTQRQLPRLARIHAIPTPDDGLEVVAVGMPALRVPVPPDDGRVVAAAVHKRAARGLAAGEQASRWFSEFLETACRLLYVPTPLAIPIAEPWGDGKGHTAFTDGFPMLLIGSGSLEELNRRLDRPVPMDRFRPNLVVSGTEPFIEDEWDEVQIGSIGLRAVKPCPRCVVTTVDQATGVRDPAGEPLVTLAGFRRREGKIWFGMNLVHEGCGTLHLGDEVRVISRRDRGTGKGIS